MIGIGDTKPDAQRIAVSCLIISTAPRHTVGTFSKVAARRPRELLVQDCANESSDTTQSTTQVNVVLGGSPCIWKDPVPLPLIFPCPSPGGGSQKISAWNPPANAGTVNRAQSTTALPSWKFFFLIFFPSHV